MQKDIVIDGKKVTFKATAYTVVKYRDIFGRDLLKDMETVNKHDIEDKSYVSGDDLSILLDFGWTMAKQADQSIPNSVEEWTDQFNTFPVFKLGLEWRIIWGLANGTLETTKKA
ncbi:MAG: hypothetical protein LKF53_02205 [Solobacterium sp.]|jgi:hypothetical protein|nr:hypothetical protein [Solobacterium sp.]MCH4226784.1 hypothetical protein [Solobacterium sp.]MCH4281887.1 hypothetical protein [Solobacterium sp.]